MVWVHERGNASSASGFLMSHFQFYSTSPTVTVSSQGPSVKALPESHCLGLKQWTAEEMEGKNLVEGVAMTEGLVSYSC